MNYCSTTCQELSFQMRTIVSQHRSKLSAMNNLPSETLIVNLQMLLKKTGISTADLAKKSGVTKRMIDYILSRERGASIDIAGKLSGAFGLNGWQLIMPSLPYDLAKTGQLDKLIENFTRCDQKSQQYISHVAEREAKG